MGYREDLQQAKQDMTEVSTSVDNLKGDVDRLHAKIAELDARPPGWTPEDQAILNDIITLSGGIKASVADLDAKTPMPDPGPTV